MTDGAVCNTSAKRMASVCLAIVTTLAFPYASLAGVGASERLEMIRACEAVLIGQSFAPLERYEAAPFSSGAPGEKEYAIYNAPQSLLVIARVSDGKWVQCTVRESEEDSLPIPERYSEWRKEITTAFPRPDYRWLRRALDGSSTNPFAVRCNGDQLVVFAFAEWSHKRQFSVTLTNEPSFGYPKNPCLEGGY